MIMRQPTIHRYRDIVSVPRIAFELTMGEGDTPLIPSRLIGPTLGINLLFKHEGMNPTGSFKDRGMIVAVSRAIERGCKGVICASTGNTAASAAAYAARAQIPCAIILPRGAVASGKLAQSIVYGARIITIDANFDACLDIVRKISGSGQWTLVNSVNPDRIAGQSTAAMEIIDELGCVPDRLVLPVGNAGNITAYWQGFNQYLNHKLSDRLPVMTGVQAAGAAPFLVGGPITDPTTVASAIRIGRPASWSGAVASVAQSGGEFIAISDEDIVAAGLRLARQEGIAAEPASVASVGGLLTLADNGTLTKGETVVAVLTGHLLKDPGPFAHDTVREAPADAGAIEDLLGRWGA